MLRRVSPAAPVEWVLAALTLLLRGPRMLLLTAGTLVCLMLTAVLVLAMLSGSLLSSGTAGATPAPRDLLMAVLPAGLLGLAAPLLLIGALGACVQALAAGQSAGLGMALRTLRARWRSLAGLTVIPLVAFALTLLSYQVFGGERYLEELWATARAAAEGKLDAQPPQGESPLLLAISGLLINWLNHGLQLLCALHVVLGGRSAPAAFAETAAAWLRNLPAMLLGGALALVGAMGLAALALAGLLVVGLIGALLPPAASLLGLALALGVATLGLVLWVSVGYCAWRGLLGDGAMPGPGGTAAPATPSQENGKDRIEL